MENKVVVFLTLENPPTVFFWDFKVNLSEQLMAAKKYTIIVIFFFFKWERKKNSGQICLREFLWVDAPGTEKRSG